MIAPPPPSPEAEYLLAAALDHGGGNTHTHSVGRSVSPVKGMPSSPVDKLEELISSASLDDDTNDATHGALAAAETADELIKCRTKCNADAEKQIQNLPLLNPGDVLKSRDIGMGFRVHDGYAISFSLEGDVMVVDSREMPFEDGKTHSVVMHYPEGFAWMYWSKCTFGTDNLTLGECARSFGMGVMTSKKSGVKTKVIFTDSSCTKAHCFIIAARTGDGVQVAVKGSEMDDSIYRIFRSCIPSGIQDDIAARELVDIRQGATLRWWQM